jgi:hypothetical protein
VLLEILANIGLTMAGFIRGMPNEERINKNLKLLKSTEWFQNTYQNNEDFFLKDDTVRYIIGWINVEKSLKSEKRTNRLKEKILDALNDR